MVKRRMTLSLRRLVLLEVAVASAMAVLLLSPATDLENGPGLRLLYALRGVRPAPRDVVIVSLDAVSARELGQPERPDRWTRRLHARLVADLATRGAAVIGFDLLFEHPRDADDDAALAAALRQAGNVVLAERLTRDPVPGAGGSVLASIAQVTRPLPALRDAAWAGAPFVMPKTPDGVFEFWEVVAEAGDRPTLPALMASRMRGVATPGADPPATTRTLNLYGPLGTVPTIRYSEALRLAADPLSGAANFAGKAVLVGYSEPNQSRQQDVFRTPFSAADGVDLSGVELCATALANLLDGSSLRRPPAPLTWPLLPLWAALLALPWGLARPAVAAALSGALWAGYAAAALVAFAVFDLWLPVVLPLAFAPLLGVGLGFAVQFGAARRRQATLEKALDLGLTRQALDRLETLLQGRLGGRTVFAACLCSDIEGYTTLSESLSPEATRDTLNAYFARFIPIIEAHGGYVTEIVADSIVSLWLADDSPGSACRRAQAAALAVDRAMNRSDDPAAMKTRLGLHYGPVFLGQVGAERRREIRAVGDIVNASSRIETANKYFGTRILASAEVAAAAPEGHWRCLGRFVVAGRTQAIELHELAPAPLPPDAAATFAAGCTAFRAGDREGAAAHFAGVLARLPDDGPARFYLQRCRERRRVGPGADGADIALPAK